MNGLECVIWHGRKNKEGYGRQTWQGKRGVNAHRIAYAESRDLDISEIAGLTILHVCDNPSCVNPGHLKPGTHKDNMHDMAVKGRSTKGMKKGPKGGRSKVTAQDVLAIRAMHTPGNRIASANVLAKQFGLSRRQIMNIVTMQCWRHVLPAAAAIGESGHE